MFQDEFMLMSAGSVDGSVNTLVTFTADAAAVVVVLLSLIV